MITWKWLTVPFSNKTRGIQVAQLWEVRWDSLHDHHFGFNHPLRRPELEAFTTKEEADTFAESLRKADSLLRHEKLIEVTVAKAK